MATLYYVHDPMCSWCYGFSECLGDLMQSLPADISIVRVLGGLAPDSDEPMPAAMQKQIHANWYRIEQAIPGVNFNHDFWTKCEPRRSTYASCRAVIAARNQGAEYDMKMTCAIQSAYYQQARNPSDVSTLIALASEIGLDAEQYAQDLESPATIMQLQDELNLARQLWVSSFPSLVLESNGSIQSIQVNYTNSEEMLTRIIELIN